MIRGVDYSWGRPGGAAVKAAGFEFVIRYVPYTGDGGKGLSAAELADLRANGLAVALVWETTASRAGEGYSAGRTDAVLASASVATLGFPAAQPIYFAVDYDASPINVESYFSGVRDTIGWQRVGVYGSYRVCQHLAFVELARYFWQALAWSGGKHLEGRHIYQELNGQTINGAAVDFNLAYMDDYGQWPEEETMGMTDNEKLAIFAGGEEHFADGSLKPTQERLALAEFRIKEAAEGRAPSIRDMAASAYMQATTTPETPGGPHVHAVPPHTHTPGPVQP